MVYYRYHREFLWYKCVWDSGERQWPWCFITPLLFMLKEKMMWVESKHTVQDHISASVPHFRLVPFYKCFPNEQGLFESRVWGDPLGLGLTCHHRGSVPGKKGRSLSQWKASQSGYGSVLVAIWLGILLLSSCCEDMLAEFLLGLIVVKEYVCKLPWDCYIGMWWRLFQINGLGLKAALNDHLIKLLLCLN